jgi:erythromycin esterase-like protein
MSIRTNWALGFGVGWQRDNLLDFILEEFGDLNGIERGPLQQLVAADPEGNAIFHRAIAAETADEAVVLPGAGERHGTSILHEVESGRIFENCAGLFERNIDAGEVEVGFYGLDLYSLNESMKAVLDYLRETDPAVVRTFSYRYACFDHFAGDPKRYGLFTGTGISKSCEDEVVAALADLRRKKGSWLGLDGHRAGEAYFCAEQNATVVADAENYYRTMLRGDVQSWNLRDRHMINTLLAIASRLEALHGRAKIIVWAHNSHIGNASATQMGRRGEFNIGQLAKEHFGAEAVLVGFTTNSGTVTAASDWDAPAERKSVRPALAHSCEKLFHETEIPLLVGFFKTKGSR